MLLPKNLMALSFEKIYYLDSLLDSARKGEGLY